jgi:preprotein translocase subunit SecA
MAHIRKLPEFAAFSDEDILTALKARVVSVISKNWQMHLQLMDALKETCYLRGFGAHRPSLLGLHAVLRRPRLPPP